MTTYPNWFAETAQQNFATYLAEFKDKPNLKFLQLGVFTGDATVWLCNNILTDDTSKLIDVDTWGGSDEKSHAEMDFVHEEPKKTSKPVQTVVAEILEDEPTREEIMMEVAKCTKVKQLTDTYFTYKQSFDSDETLMKVLKMKKENLK